MTSYQSQLLLELHMKWITSLLYRVLKVCLSRLLCKAVASGSWVPHGLGGRF